MPILPYLRRDDAVLLIRSFTSRSQDQQTMDSRYPRGCWEPDLAPHRSQCSSTRHSALQSRLNLLCL